MIKLRKNHLSRNKSIIVDLFHVIYIYFAHIFKEENYY